MRNSKLNREIIDFLLESRNRKSLLQGLSSIFDEICKIKRKENENDQTLMGQKTVKREKTATTPKTPKTPKTHKTHKTHKSQKKRKNTAIEIKVDHENENEYENPNENESDDDSKDDSKDDGSVRTELTYKAENGDIDDEHTIRESSVGPPLYAGTHEIENENENENDSDGTVDSVTEDEDEEDEDEDTVFFVSKKEKVMKFEEQFYQYFVEMSDQSKNFKTGLKTFLLMIFFEIGIFWKIRNDRSLWDDKMEQFAGKLANLSLIDLCMCDEFGQTLYHFSASMDNAGLLNLLLSIDNDFVKYKNKQGLTAKDDAIRYGQWSIVQQIALAKMGNKMKNQAKDEEKRIESKRGIVQQFLNERRLIVNEKQSEKKETKTNKNSEKENNNSNNRFEDDLCEEMLKTLLNLISKKLPISDDMLLLCWKYEMMKTNGSEKENRLWKVLKRVIQDVLDNSKNKRIWIWFKNSIFASTVCNVFCLGVHDVRYGVLEVFCDGALTTCI